MRVPWVAATGSLNVQLACYRACCTYIPTLPANSPFSADSPASLPGWSVLLCLALALSRACLGAVAFLEALCIARLFLELPFSQPFGSAVFLRSATSLPLLICLYWLGALCVLCVLRVLRGCVSLTYQPRAPAFAAALVCYWWFSAGLFHAPAILVLALVLFLQLPAPVVRVVLLGLLLAPVSELNWYCAPACASLAACIVCTPACTCTLALSVCDTAFA